MCVFVGREHKDEVRATVVFVFFGASASAFIFHSLKVFFRLQDSFLGIGTLFYLVRRSEFGHFAAW